MTTSETSLFYASLVLYYTPVKTAKETCETEREFGPFCNLHLRHSMSRQSYMCSLKIVKWVQSAFILSLALRIRITSVT